MERDGELLRGFVIAPEELPTVELPPGATFLVGAGTGAKLVVRALAERGITPELVEEAGTSLAARDLYFAANPPRGLARLVPRGMLAPPVPIDDFAAYAIALRWLQRHEGSRGGGR